MLPSTVDGLSCYRLCVLFLLQFCSDCVLEQQLQPQQSPLVLKCIIIYILFHYWSHLSFCCILYRVFHSMLRLNPKYCLGNQISVFADNSNKLIKWLKESKNRFQWMIGRSRSNQGLIGPQTMRVENSAPSTQWAAVSILSRLRMEPPQNIYATQLQSFSLIHFQPFYGNYIIYSKYIIK